MAIFPGKTSPGTAGTNPNSQPLPLRRLWSGLPQVPRPVDEILENLILDVWSRSWHLETGKFCSPVQAVMFSVMIRVPLCAGRAIQMASGNKGFYAEPRSPCGKLADEAFGVVWLPQAQLPDVRHRFTTTLEALCVCRLHHKYGIRFAQQHLEQAHSALKPQEAFINSKIQKIYRLYPLPFGTQRTGLQQCISKWSWSAKVLNAVGGGPEGAAWEVGSAQEPPSAVMQCTFGDVTVTLVRQMNQDPQPAPLLASSSTKAHIRSGRPEPASASSTGGASDPWLIKDPWGGFQKTGDAPDRLKQFETQLRADVVSQVQAQIHSNQHMEVDGTAANDVLGARMSALEVSVHELQHQGARFEQDFNEVQTNTVAQAGRIDTMANRVEQHGRDVELLRTDLRTQVGLLQEGQHSLQDSMGRGFAQLEALLEKKSRHA